MAAEVQAPTVQAGAMRPTMEMTVEQRAIVDYYLSPRTGDELEPPETTLRVTKRQLAFLLDAIEHYAATSCPLGGDHPSGCTLTEWYEEPGTGAMRWDCFAPCTTWRDTLIRDVVPRAFGLTGRPPVSRPVPPPAPAIVLTDEEPVVVAPD